MFQAEIKRMREANKAASRERQLLLQQREEISRLRQSTKQVRGENSRNLMKIRNHETDFILPVRS